MTELVAPDGVVSLSGNVSMALDDPARSWIVTEGRVLVFATDERDDSGPEGESSAPGPRNLVLEAGADDLLVGVDAGGSGRRWVVVGIAKAEIRAVPAAEVLSAAARHDDEARTQLDRWLARTGARGDDPVDPQVAGAAVDDLLARPDPAAALTDHGRRAALAEAERVRSLLDEQSSQIVAAESQATSATESAVDALASVFDWRRFLQQRLTEGDDDLIDACRVVGDRLGITIKPPMPEDLVRSDLLSAIARASKVRFRKVRLPDDWWRREGEPLIGQLTDGTHVALLPRRGRGYSLVDQSSERSTVVTRTVANDIRPIAIAVVRPLPARGLQLSGIVRFGLHGEGRNVTKLVAFAGVMALLALIPPLATQTLFSQIVPRADYSRLVALVIGLIGVSFAIVLFRVARDIALLRARVRSDTTVQLALWDRMLRLPPTFFRGYQVGDLAERSLTVSSLSDQVSDSVVLALISGVFGLFNIVAMLIISPKLTVVGVVISAFGGLVIFLSHRAGRGPQHDDLEGERQLSSDVLQYFTGIVKIRTSGSERRFFSRWANSYAQQNVRELAAFKIDNGRTVFQSAFRTVGVLLLFLAVYFIGRDDVPASTFFAFYLASGQLLWAIFQMSASSVAVLDGAPLFEECRPIVDAATEADEPKEHPGQLSGRIEVRNVRFRYPGAPSDLFEDVSLSIEPGEFVAVVGPSGSGKSTLLRLLLGFDLPAAGTISYDGHELSALDIDAVRQQLGVVLQQTALLPGTIYQNIAGSADLSADDVWDAARHAGLDRDIERMPDGMDTEIGEGVSLLSGGQRQRLQIARALASKPRLLFLDEATSALDNLTQSVVTQTVSEMPITRVVIAHRLSTIEAADRVVVIAGGRVVQDGPFDELAHTPGPFAELIARQQL